MTSDKKVAANRLNAKKSTGPRTRRGKSRASRNAWRHGWAVAKTGRSKTSAHVEWIAEAICGGHGEPALYEQAVIIAECEIVLLNLRAARVAAVERKSNIEPKPETSNQVPALLTAQESVVPLPALERGEPCQAIGLCARAARAIAPADAKLAQAKPEATSTGHLANEQFSPRPMTISDADAQRSSGDQRTLRRQEDVAALQRMLPELISLERYEQRALSRRNRAIRMFEAISIVAPFLGRETKGS